MGIKKLKGGSLSTTYHIKNSYGDYVMKQVSREKEREYGFMRWYSQTKKQQRLHKLHPEYIPAVTSISSHDDVPLAELWMPYLEGYTDVKTILSTMDLSEEQIFKISKAIWRGFDAIHSNTYDAIAGAGELYYSEEVLQKYLDAQISNKEFEEFTHQVTFDYHGEIAHNIYNYLYYLEEYFFELKLPYEQDILGNPTLENIMYSFDEDKVKFIDLYEESMIDTRFLDYSMVLQCCNSHYGFINDNSVIIDNNSVTHELQIPKNFETFKKHFEADLPEGNRQLIDILEATQFIRMLPFKVKAGDIDKAKYFYVHACYLLGKALK